jgi:hypothetical protein
VAAAQRRSYRAGRTRSRRTGFPAIPANASHGPALTRRTVARPRPPLDCGGDQPKIAFNLGSRWPPARLTLLTPHIAAVDLDEPEAFEPRLAGLERKAPIDYVSVFSGREQRCHPLGLFGSQPGTWFSGPPPWSGPGRCCRSRSTTKSAFGVQVPVTSSAAPCRLGSSMAAANIHAVIADLAGRGMPADLVSCGCPQG